MLTLENIQLGKIINKKLGGVKKGFKFVFNKQKTNIMNNEWIYTAYNYTTEMYEVLKQVRGVKNDKVLKSFKREGNAHNYELTLINFPNNKN